MTRAFVNDQGDVDFDDGSGELGWNGGDIGITADGVITYGSDGAHCGVGDMEVEQRRALAELMIHRWQEFAEGRKPQR